jgi:HK97 family phage major capsid protein
MGIMISRRSFTYNDGTDLIEIAKGERVDSAHAAVQEYREFFVSEDEIRSAPAANREAGTSYRQPTPTDPDPFAARLRAGQDEALRAIERHADAFASGSDTEIERLVRHHDPDGRGSQYLAAVGDPNYGSAFGKLLRFGPMAGARMTREETEAMTRVNMAERAMNVTTGSAGQFAIPLEIDPSIIMSGTGSLNPWRSVATVRTMISDTLRLVSSDGVTAAYAQEATEASDNSPTLAQPTINAARGQCFVPFSWELGQDWGSLQQELGKLIADARDVVDATHFVTGDGSEKARRHSGDRLDRQPDDDAAGPDRRHRRLRRRGSVGPEGADAGPRDRPCHLRR